MKPIILLVVAKAPVPGLAKTRLCPPATPLQAARLAAASLLDTLNTVLAVPETIPVVALTGDLGACEHAEELSAHLAATTVVPQRGDGFAERLAHAHADASRAQPGLPVLQIGMDTPQVSIDLLAEGARLLTSPGGPESLIGPALDGGWWALGLRRPELASLLTSVPMSRVDTCDRTRRVLRQAGAPPADVPHLSDVDVMDDAESVAALVPGSRFTAALAEMSGAIR